MIAVAIIGLGAIGQRYVTLIEQQALLRLVAICDSNQPSKFGSKSLIIPCYQSITEMFCAHPEIKLTIVCSPNGLHCQHSIEALNNGSSVLCEKPLAISSTDAALMLRTAQATQQQLFCVMQNRYSPAVQFIKQLIEKQALGNIFMVEVHCFWNRDEKYYQSSNWRGTMQLDGGTLFTQFSHFVDLILWLFGPIEINHAQFRNFTHQEITQFEDSGTVSFSFKNEGIGSFSFSTSAPNQNFDSSINIVAQNGCLRLGGQYMDTIEYCSVPNSNLNFEINNTTNHASLLQNVANVLLGNAKIDIDPQDGLLVVQTIEQMYAASIHEK